MRRVLRDNFCELSRLREYVEAVFLPGLEWNGKSSSHIERHTAALDYVERFARQPLSPEDLDEQLVLHFDAWLWRQGIADGRRRDLVESLRRIAAAYTPEQKRCRTKRCCRPVLPDPPAGSLRLFYEAVHAPLYLVGRTARYIDENRAALWRLYEHYGRDVLLSECTDALLAEHLGWLLDSGLRPATINTGHLSVIRGILQRAYERGLIDSPPRVRSLPVDRNTPDAWTPDQVTAFIAACAAASERPIAGIVAGDWWEALVRTIWYSGLRRRALFAIRLDPPDVDLQTGWLRVPGSSMKNRSGKQFRLGDDALEAIARVWAPRRKLLFEFPYEKGVFYDQFHRIRKAAGLPRSTSNLGALHLLRRSVATEAARNHGIGAAQTLLGHCSPRVTLRYIDESKMPGADFTNVLRPLPRRGTTPAPRPVDGSDAVARDN